MGMTLEEAVKHAEEVMMENLDKTKGRNASDPTAIKCGECAEEHRQLAEWLKELKQLREQTRWIPVSERLPEVGIDVLAFNMKGYEYLAHRSSFGGYFDEWGDEIEDIIAWMPLPEPYKMESEEEK